MTHDEGRTQYFLSRAAKRLNRDMKLILSDPIPGIHVAPNEDDILDWHFAIQGKNGSSYENGVYHGKLVFPPNFPFAPPKIMFLTPNGRFKVNERICFSLSDFHPEEWKPAYSVTAVLRGVYEFMHESTDTIGSIDASESERKQLAQDSNKYNLKNASFCKLFPLLCNEDTEMDINSPVTETRIQEEYETEPNRALEISPITEYIINLQPLSTNTASYNDYTISPITDPANNVSQTIEHMQIGDLNPPNIDTQDISDSIDLINTQNATLISPSQEFNRLHPLRGDNLSHPQPIKYNVVPKHAYTNPDNLTIARCTARQQLAIIPTSPPEIPYNTKSSEYNNTQDASTSINTFPNTITVTPIEKLILQPEKGTQNPLIIAPVEESTNTHNIKHNTKPCPLKISPIPNAKQVLRDCNPIYNHLSAITLPGCSGPQNSHFIYNPRLNSSTQKISSMNIGIVNSQCSNVLLYASGVQNRQYSPRNPVSTPVPFLHKTKRRHLETHPIDSDIRELEEGNLRKKRSLSSPGSNTFEINCYYFALLIIAALFAVLLVFLLAILTINLG